MIEDRAIASDLFGGPAPTARPARAMGGHQSSRAGTHTWLTPLPLVRAVGPFDLDPCAVPNHPTADRLICLPNDGLAADWRGARVWMNPPYGHYAAAWLRRLAHHGRGTALIFARTETEAFMAHVWRAATALLFLEGRINFHWAFPDGVTGDPTECHHRWGKMDPALPKSGLACTICGMAQANSGAPSVLVAYGMADADVLAGEPLAGAFVPLLVPRGWLVMALPEPSWSGLVRSTLGGRGPVSLSTLYRLVQTHPKATRNPHWRAKVRQVLQQGPFERVDRGVWRAA